MNIYLKAWKLLLERLEQKTGWGKEEIKKLMLKCLLDAGESEVVTVIDTQKPGHPESLPWEQKE
jgi:hypothetical protein